MKDHVARVGMCFALACSIAVGVARESASEQKSGGDAAKAKSADASAQKSKTSAPVPIYRPPSIGQPSRTVGGGTRGSGDGFPSVYALVPDHPGRTTAAQPTLFYYVDEVPPASAKVRFTLLDEKSDVPVVEKELPAPSLWYDALAELDGMIKADPSDPAPAEMRSALLRQVGLDAAADAR
jgi:hypothetical protein